MSFIYLVPQSYRQSIHIDYKIVFMIPFLYLFYQILFHKVFGLYVGAYAKKKTMGE